MGTWHINDPDNPMFSQIKEQVEKFKPEVILVERLQPIAATAREAAGNLLDAGFCRYIGYTKQIPVYTWDFSWNMPYYCALSSFKPDELMVTMVAFQNGLFAQLDIQEFEEYYREQVNNMEAGGWTFTPEQKEMAYFRKAYQSFFGERLVEKSGKDFARQLWKNHESPRFLSIFHTVQYARDAQLIAVLKQQLEKYDRVFVQAGSSHGVSVGPLLPESSARWKIAQSGCRRYSANGSR
ncbi:hypothetical protein MKQ68_16540 [Chitinophaga horti]|uniref:Uncharacterized protein n=1 Tax=Chitinophaga horti TaxID=2920382 RepID=A0ABY6IWE2_9BACT|nr:hypothetical protein [Chitinophaga horti]UYQ91698.1 hypothetical protein MKQ68_16540 [Chitinophaga horti]